MNPKGGLPVSKLNCRAKTVLAHAGEQGLIEIE